MSNTNLVNGAPMTILLGTQDKSTRVPAITPEAIPTHLPKVYLYAAKGPTVPQLVVGNGRNQMYGDDTFDLRKAFATHQTALSNTLNEAANAQMIERVIPKDAGPKANFLLSLDVLRTSVQQYHRDQFGNYKLDQFGIEIPVVLDASTGEELPVGTPLSAGIGKTDTCYKAKWVISAIGSHTFGEPDENLFGRASVTAGDQVEGLTQSQRYPILQFWANSYGSYFNNCGLRIWAPTENSAGGVNSGVLLRNKAYPFRMAAVRRASANLSPRVVDTESGEPYFDFVLKPNQINSATDARITLKDIYLNKYQTTNDLRFAPKYGDLNGIYVYEQNIDLLVKQFYEAEKDALDRNNAWDTSDLTFGNSDEAYMMNFISARTSTGVPYYSLMIDSAAADGAQLSESSNLMARCGSDGTMNDELFAELVSEAVAEYANPDSQLMNTAVNVESILYDTGFPVSTKYELCKFIAERKDTGVVLCPYVVNGRQLSASEENSLAVTLRTKLQNYPESDYFGTPVFRGLIMGRNGILRDSQYNGRLPLTIELAYKSALMMGASNGVWKEEYIFDKEPNNVIKMFDDVSIAFTPSKQRNKDWDAGLNYPLSHTRKTLYFPALKTVYEDETSVLNSFFVMMACIQIQKVGERVHRAFSGVTTLSDSQLVEKVNQKVEELTAGVFANMFKVVPAARISAADGQRGFSWTLPIKLYANNMKTVQLLSIEAYRSSDLKA